MLITDDIIAFWLSLPPLHIGFSIGSTTAYPEEIKSIISEINSSLWKWLSGTS